MINVAKIAKSNIKHNKSKSILIILTIFLATTLLGSVAMVGLDWNELNKKNVIERYGNYHGAYAKTDEETYEKIKTHADLESVGRINGIGALDEFEDETKIGLSHVDENALNLNSIKLSEGKMPTKENEIVIDDLALEKLGYEQKINQTISIKYNDHSSEETIEKEFVVTGILKSSEAAQVRKMYTIIVSEEYMLSTRDMSKESFNTFFRIKGADNMSSYDMEMVIEEIGDNFGIKKANTLVNENYVNLIKPDMFVIGSIVVICLVVIISSILVIYNIFYLSIITKVQEFGKLRAIGATKKQIRKIILKEGMYLSAIAIPLGLVAGVLVSEFITKYMLGESVEASKLILTIAIGIISLITVYISLIKPMKIASKVSIVEAVKYNGDENTKKKTRKGYDYVDVSKLTKANLALNKKRTYVTLLSLTLSGIIFIIVSCALSSMDAEVMAKQHMPYDMTVSLDNYTFGDETSPNTELNILQKKDILGDTFIEELQSIDGVEEVQISDKVIKSEVLNIDMETQFHDLTGIDESDLEYMEMYLQDGKIDLEKLKSGKEIVLNFSMYADMHDIKVGDTLSLKLHDGDTSVTKDFKVQAITDGPGTFVLHKDVLNKLVKTNTTTSLGINVKKNSYDEVKGKIETIVDSNPNFGSTFIDLEIEAYELAIRLYSVMGYSLVTLIGVIGFINLINSMITSIITRKKELGMLQAIGLTNKQLTKMLNKEAMFYTSFMLAGSLTIGNILGYIGVQAMRNSGASYATYQLPITQMIIMTVCVVGAQLLLTYLISKSFNKESLIDRVRYND